MLQTSSQPDALPAGVELVAPRVPGDDSVLTPGALGFVAALVRRFGPRIEAALRDRAARQARFDAGELPDFLPDTAPLRAAPWTVAAPPAEIADRRVEITGPVDRKMMINALNSGARVFMADMEDSNTPTWENLVRGQQNLQDAVRRTIELRTPEKHYRLDAATAVLFVRPRGLHLYERHLRVDGRLAPGSLVDFGLFFFHCAREQVARGTRPYFYLPKLESHLEARIWDEVLSWGEACVGLPRGTARATVLIETLPAAFEMDEILWELRDHSAGLNCGRWDYIFSFIKKLRSHPSAVLPDRAQVGMDRAFLRAYSRLLVQTCHRRGAHAMGGMAAQIPIKGDAEANERALARVRADKLREVGDGHDGTWVAHPGLVPVAKAVFDEAMPGPNQIARIADVTVTRDDLLRVHEGTRTLAGIRHDARVGVLYLEFWLRGTGCVPIDHLMEDAATAEICRVGLWQSLHHHAVLADGQIVTPALVERVLGEVVADLREEVGARFDTGRFAEAIALFRQVATREPLADFLTVPASTLID